MTSNTKVLEDNIWKNIEKVNGASLSTVKPTYCVNLVTSNGYIPLFYEKTFLDYCEVNDEYINDVIDDILEHA